MNRCHRYNKTHLIVLLGYILLGIPLAGQVSSDTTSVPGDTSPVDSTAVENKFRMYDLGVSVEASDEEKKAAEEQLEQMATQSAKSFAQKEQERARTRIDSMLQAEAVVDSAPGEDIAQKDSVTRAEQAGDIASAEHPGESGAIGDSLITLEQLRARLHALRVKYQQQITDLRDQNTQLIRKVEYLENKIARTRKEDSTQSVSMAERNPDRKSLQPQPRMEKDYLLGVRLYYNSNFSTALTHFERVVELSGDPKLVANAQYWIGGCYYQLSNFSQAIEEMHQYITKFQDAAQRKDAMVIIGLSYKRTGELTKALEYFEQVVEKYPESEYAKIAKSEVKKLRYVTS